MKLKVNWSVDTGFLNYPKYTVEVDVEKDLMDLEEWNGLSEDEKQQELEDYVHGEFEKKISWNVDSVEEI